LLVEQQRVFPVEAGVGGHGRNPRDLVFGAGLDGLILGRRGACGKRGFRTLLC